MIIIVWQKPDNTFYYRFVKCSYKNYYVGYFNQYGHKIVLIIENPYLNPKQLSIRPYVKNIVYKIYCKI